MEYTITYCILSIAFYTIEKSFKNDCFDSQSFMFFLQCNYTECNISKNYCCV